MDNGKDIDDGRGGMRCSGNCSGNVVIVDSGMRRGGKGSIPIPAALANLSLSLSSSFSSASMPASSFLTTAKAVEGGGGGGGSLSVGGVVVVPVGGEMIRYNAPYPVGDAPVCNGVDSVDANSNKDGGDVVVRSVRGKRGVGFCGREEEKDQGRGEGGRMVGAGW